MSGFQPSKFDFRGLHPHILLGTASDRYAGWLGQIYTRDRYTGRISKRQKKIKGKSFQEQTLPVDSVQEYFAHFPILEIDYTLKKRIIRLMTPRGMRYEDAYARAYPFDQIRQDMLQPGMIDQTVDLLNQAAASSIETSVIINNRSGGNAPLIAQKIAEKFQGI